MIPPVSEFSIDSASAKIPLSEEAEPGVASFWLEMICVSAFTIGFLLWRAFHQPQTASRKKGGPVHGKIMKSLETSLSAGDSQAALKAWRSQQEKIPSSPDLLRLAMQALLEVSEKTAVDEVVDHLMTHKDRSTPLCAVSVLDIVARAGKTNILDAFVGALETRLHLRLTSQMHEIILGGYAFSGSEDKLQAHLTRMRASGEELSVRAHSLVLRGLLRNRQIDAALAQAKKMLASGFTVPFFAHIEIVKAFCEVGRYTEVLDSVLPEIAFSAEAATILLEQCLKRDDLATALRVKEILDKEKLPLGVRGFDTLLKLLAGAGDQRALELFVEMQNLNLPISEGLCVGLLARSADSKFLLFAEVVVKYARTHLKMNIALYSALMKAYAYSGMYDKACDLYDQILAEDLEPDQMMYNCLMKFAAMCGRVALSQQLADKIPTLDVQNYMSLIRAASRDKDVNLACGVLQKLRAMGQMPDTAAYNCALDVCAQAGDLERAKVLIAEMRELKACPDIITYNTMLKCFALKKDMRGAKAMLAEMEAAGFPPNDISYNVIINMAVSSGQFKEAWEIVKEMSDKGIKVDQYTISTMLKAVKKSKSHRDAMLVFELCDRSNIDITSDEVLLNTVLETCLRFHENRRIESILASFAASKLRPAMHTFGMLMRACGSIRQVDRCRELWHEMVHHRALVPNDLVLGCMLNALVSNDSVDEAVALLRQWKGVVKPNAVMYSTLLKGFTTKRGAGKALELLEEMRDDNIEMNTSLYNSLIDVQARVGGIDEVLKLYDMMQQDGCAPDDLTTSLMVKAHCASGNVKMAFKVFDSMSTGRVGDGDTIIYNTLLDGCVRNNDFEMADYLIESLDSYRIKPTNFTLGIVVKMWGRRRELDKAFEAANTMTNKYNFELNDPVRTCLMCACLLNDDLGRSLQAFEELKTLGGGADARAYGNIISGAARLGNINVAVQLTEEAYGLTDVKVGFRPHEIDASVLDQLQRSMMKVGAVESIGLPLFRKLRDRGVPIGSHIAAMMRGDLASPGGAQRIQKYSYGSHAGNRRRQ